MHLGGLLTLKINGKSYAAMGDFKYGGSYEKRDPVIGHSILGYSTSATEPFIEGEIVLQDNFYSDIAGIKDATITIELANGKVFSLYDAWCVNEKGIEVSTKERKVAVRFVGLKCMES